MTQLPTLENPMSGERVVFLERASQTNGQLLRFEWFVRSVEPLPERAKRAPGHAHPAAEERIRVLAGKLWVRSGGVERTLTTGQEVVVPPRTPHAWWNVGTDEVSAIVEFRPAGRVESLFETTFGMARNSTKPGAFGTLLQYAVVFHEFRDEISVLEVSDRLGVSLLWPVGKLLGYRSDVPIAKVARQT